MFSSVAMSTNIIPQPSSVQEMKGEFDMTPCVGIDYTGKLAEVNGLIERFIKQMSD